VIGRLRDGLLLSGEVDHEDQPERYGRENWKKL
jgi:hypothetical protein